jgi:outer membrane biosynthesis protein TonB
MTSLRAAAAASAVAFAALVSFSGAAHADETTDDTEDHSLPLETHFDDPKPDDETAPAAAAAPAPVPVPAPAAPAAPPVPAPPPAPAALKPVPVPSPVVAPAPEPAPAPAPSFAPTFALAGASASDEGRGEKPTHADPSSPSTWHLALGVDTDAPLDVAGRFSLETPGRIRLSTALGTTPQAYASAVDGILRAVNAYDAGTSALFRAGFGKSLVWRTHAGIRPFANHGFYADAGYALVKLSGDTTASAVASAAGEGAVAGYVGDASYQLGTTLQMVDAEIGWEFPLVQGFRLRTAIGGAFTLASSTTITAPTADNSLTARASQDVDHAFQTYGFLPVVTVGLDYRFF